jgi:hypothetical protein
VLSIRVPSSVEVKEGSNSYTGYTVQCKYGSVEWSVIRRYSQFLDLKTRMEKETIKPSAPFPKKGFGSLGAAALAKRREQLDAYISELSGAFLPEHLYDHLCLFVEMKANLAKAANKEGASNNSDAAPATAAAGDGGGGGGQIDGEDSVRTSNWDANYMNADPLAGLLDEAPKPPPTTTTDASPKLKPAPAPKSPAAGSTPAPAAPLPAFLSFGSSKTYPADGEGLRDAIKAGDVSGVKQVIKDCPSACNYQDRLSQTMLHLAAIFNHSEIAELLLEAGADPTIPNSDKETAIDVAQPTLKRKMKAVHEARSS